MEYEIDNLRSLVDNVPSMQSLLRCCADRERPVKSWIHAVAALSVVLLSLQNAGRAAPKEEWQPIAAEELAETAPQLLPDAAAEILFLKVEVDDGNFPEERVRREYLRAKIYKPEHIESLTRISGLEVSDDSYFGVENKVKLSARLTLPDGTTKVFGDEAIRERTLVQSGEKNLLDRILGSSGQQVKQRFLAVGGAEAGAILEYKIERRERSNIGGYSSYNVFAFQRPGLGIRKAEVRVSPPSSSEWNYRYFVLNPTVAHAIIKEDPKRKTLTLEPRDVPPITEEPMAGLSYSYHAVCLMSCYEKRDQMHLSRHNGQAYTIQPSKTGPWSLYSIADFKTQQDYFETTARIRKFTEETVGDATSAEEKAKRIHDRLRALHAQYVKESKFNKTEILPETFCGSLEPLLTYDRKTSVVGIGQMDFLVLGLVMYKIAGLESRIVLLPDRRMAPFNQNLPTRVFVPNRALQVNLGDHWVYSMPLVHPFLPFGDIPWYCEGQVALVVKDGPEEFIPVPFSDSGKSLIANGGTFELKADGTLTGIARRKYTGNAAFAMRSLLFSVRSRNPARQRGILARQISRDFKVALKRSRAVEDEGGEGDEQPIGAVSIKRISGLDIPEAPLEIEYQLTLPNFATVTEHRLIFRPWVFRANETNPFTGESRIKDVYFPYALQELDLVSLKLPSGYKPEFSEEYVAVVRARRCTYKATISFDEASRTLKLRREYASNLVVLPVSAYPLLKSGTTP